MSYAFLCWRRFLLLILCLVVGSSQVTAQTNEPAPGHSIHGEAFNEGPRQKAYLMGGTGGVKFPVTTASVEAQSFVTQGVGQLHGFWYWEAERSFRQAAMLDTNCAMAFWGMAMANINNPKRASEMIKLAGARTNNCTEREQLYIQTYSKFYPVEDPKKKEEDKSASDNKNKDRRKELVKNLETIIDRFPEDIEARAFLAFHAWDNSGHGHPIPSPMIQEGFINEILRESPNHPAHHYMIHLWDGEKASRALDSAAKCGQSAPAIAHMWHMPGHTYTKLQRYHDVVWQQEASARVDHAYMRRDWVLPDQIHNYAHNNQWLVEGMGFVGRIGDALDLARNLIELPRHPKYNMLSKTNVYDTYERRDGSGTTGRSRLLELLVRFELWKEILALADTVYLEPTEYPVEQARRIRAIALAHFYLGEEKGFKQAVSDFEKIFRAAKDERQEMVERSETKAKEEKLADDKVQKAMSDALQAYTDKMKSLDSFQAELKGYGSFREKNYEAAWKSFESAKDLAKERLARLRLEAGDQDKACEISKEALNSGTNQVHLLASHVDVLFRCGKEDESRKWFEKLRTLSGEIDLEIACFHRLTAPAKKFGFPADWRLPLQSRVDVGQRPRLNELGALRWEGPETPAWQAEGFEDQKIISKNYKNKPYLLVLFLGTQCGHCMKQLNDFSPFFQRFKDEGIQMVALSTESKTVLKENLARSNKQFPFILGADPELQVFKSFRAFDDFEESPLHGTYLVDGEGRVRWLDISSEPFMEPKFLLNESKRLLAQTPKLKMKLLGSR